MASINPTEVKTRAEVTTQDVITTLKRLRGFITQKIPHRRLDITEDEQSLDDDVEDDTDEVRLSSIMSYCEQQVRNTIDIENYEGFRHLAVTWDGIYKDIKSTQVEIDSMQRCDILYLLQALALREAINAAHERGFLPEGRHGSILQEVQKEGELYNGYFDFVIYQSDLQKYLDTLTQDELNVGMRFLNAFRENPKGPITLPGLRSDDGNSTPLYTLSAIVCRCLQINHLHTVRAPNPDELISLQDGVHIGEKPKHIRLAPHVFLANRVKELAALSKSIDSFFKETKKVIESKECGDGCNIDVDPTTLTLYEDDFKSIDRDARIANAVLSAHNPPTDADYLSAAFDVARILDTMAMLTSAQNRIKMALSKAEPKTLVEPGASAEPKTAVETKTLVETKTSAAAKRDVTQLLSAYRQVQRNRVPKYEVLGRGKPIRP